MILSQCASAARRLRLLNAFDVLCHELWGKPQGSFQVMSARESSGGLVARHAGSPPPPHLFAFLVRKPNFPPHVEIIAI